MSPRKEQKDWADIYQETVLFKEVVDVPSDKSWRLKTGDPKIAARVRRKRRYQELSLKWMWGPCRLWFFQTAYSKRGNAIRSLSRILKRKCNWDEKRQLIAVKKGNASEERDHEIDCTRRSRNTTKPRA